MYNKGIIEWFVPDKTKEISNDEIVKSFEDCDVKDKQKFFFAYNDGKDWRQIENLSKKEVAFFSNLYHSYPQAYWGKK
jgi:hypothetical protein